MHLNRDNYEAYFLLYTDNELSVEEKYMVELFLQDNPDLLQELEMLQLAVLPAESFVFSNKSSLIKHSGIDEAMQQRLVLLMDDELPALEAQQLATILATDSSLAAEWISLQQTKLSAADSIAFPDKSVLYKKERGRVIPIGWWRLAVAAMLIGFGIWGGIAYQKNAAVTGQNSVVQSGQKVPPIVPIEDLSLKTNTEQSNKVTATEDKVLSNNTVTPQQVIATASVPEAASPKKIQTALSVRQTGKFASLPQKQNNVKEFALQNINMGSSNNIAKTNVPPLTSKTKNEITTLAETVPVENLYAVNASFKEDSDIRFASFDDEDGIEKDKKTKLGGFFKKVKRVLERKAHIKTGNNDNIKIANMSFAMH